MKKLLNPSLALLVVLVLFTSSSLRAQTPWLSNTGAKCPPEAFLSKSTSSTAGTKLYSLDLYSGAETVFFPSDFTGTNSTNRINGIGYNQKDGFMWGSLGKTDQVVRISKDGTVNYYTITGLSIDGYASGDVSADGKLYLARRASSGVAPTGIAIVDVNPASATYLGAPTQLNTTYGTVVSSLGFLFYDMAFNPVDGQLYALNGGGTGGAELSLIRINPTTGAVTLLSPRGSSGFSWQQENPDGTFSAVATPFLDVEGRFGACYFDPKGNFYVQENAQFGAASDFSQTTGRAYKFSLVHTYTGSAVRTALLVGSGGKSAAGNDGARCPNAEIPCPIITKPVAQTAPSCVAGSTFDLTTLNPSPAAAFTTYEWRTGGNTVAGSTVVANPKTAAVPGTYYMFAKRSGTTCYHSAPDALGVQVVLIAGPAAPTLSTTTGQVCPGNTFSLTGLITSTAPTGITYEWWTTSTRNTGTQVTTPTAVSAGTYYGFAKNSTGCYGAATAAVTVTSVSVTTPTPTTTGTICSPSTTFNLTTLISAAPSGTTYEWWTTNTRTAGTQVTAPTTAAAGTYYLFARNNTSGCYSLASSLVTITAAPKPVPAAFTLIGCASVSLTSLQPAAISGYTFEWHTAATVASGTLVSTPSAVTASGTYYLHARRNSSTPACYGPASDPVTVTVTPGPTTPMPTATSGDICNPSTTFDLTTLQPAAQSGFTYEWWTTTTRNAGTQVSNPSAAGAGVYYLFIKNTSDACYSNASVSVTISTVSGAPTKTTDLLCSTSSTYNLTTIQPSAVTGVTYEWWTTSTRTAGTQVATPAAVSAGVYYFFAKKGTDCYSAPSTVTILGKPVPTALTASNTCPTSSTVNLTLLQPAAVTGFTYEWYLKSSNTKVTTPTAVATAGAYYLVLTSTTAPICSTAASDDVVVTITECPLACAEDQTYFFQYTGSSSNTTTIYRINLCTGSTSNNTILKTLPYQASAAGFNPATNFLWVARFGTGTLVRLDASLNETTFAVTNSSGAALPSYNWNLADFDSSGKLYLAVDGDAAAGTGTMYVVDLNPTSAGYLKYTTVALSQSKIFRDWAMNPVDENLYALDNSSSGFYRITKTGTVTQIGTMKNSSGASLAVEPAGVQYFDGGGNFWFLQHTSLGVWRVPGVSAFTAGTTSRTATQFSTRNSGITLSQPDGARCNTAPACGSDCPTTLTIPTTGNICSPSTTFNLTEIQPTVPTGFVLEWWTTSGRTTGTKVSTPSAVAAGTYYLFAKTSSGIYCTATASIVVAVAVAKPVPTAFSASNNCTTSPTVNLTLLQPAAVTGFTYEWHNASTVGANTLVATPSSVSVAGTYYLFLKRNNTTCYGPASNPVTVTITPCNQPPTAYPNAYTTPEDTPVSGNVISDLNTAGQKDTDPNNNTLSVSQFTVTGVTGTFNAGQTATIPNVGTLQINADGSFTFTPVLNYNGPVPTANYTISDGNGGTASSTLDLSVTPVNDPPKPVNDTNTTPEDTPVSGNVLTNDTDPEGNAFTVSQFSVNGTTYSAGQTATIPGKGTIVVNSDGSYTFTPAPDYNGAVPTVSYTVSETATGLTATADLNINITPANDPPVAVNDQATTDEDTPATGTVLSNDSDIDGDALTVSGFTVNGTTITPGQTATIAGVGDILINSDGTYTFTPAPNFNGTVPPIPYTISDGKGGTANANLNITVRPVNDAPTAVDDTNTTPEDTPVSANVLPNDTDPESDPVTVTGFSVNGQSYAPGSTATISGVGTILLNADGSYTFTPELNYNGTVPDITYSVTDGKGTTASAKLQLTVTPVNDPPVAGNDTEDTPNFTPVSGDLFPNDRDIDGDTFAVSGVSLDGINFVAPGTELTFTEGKITVNADGTYTFTPADGFFGTVPPIYYKVTDPDNLTSNVARLDLTVTFENVPPVAVNDAKSTDEDVPVSGNVITDFDSNNNRDSDIDSPITELVILDFMINGTKYTSGTTAPLPGVGTLVINVDGSWTFTPELNYNGPVPVATYTLADNAVDGNDGTDTATLTITINPVNDAPTALNDVNTTKEDTPVSANVLPNDSDLEGNTLSVSEFKVGGVTYTAGTTATIPGVGTIVINSDGSYTFTPATNFNGTVPSVEYTAADGNGGTATAKLDIAVTPANDNPVAVADTKSTPEDTPVSDTVLPNDSDVDGDPLAVTQFTVNGQTYPAGSTATINGVGTLKLNADGTYTFTPEKDYNGNVPVAAYEVSDGNGGTATATLTITVTPVNDNPVAVNDTNTTVEDTPVSASVLPNDSDVEGDDLTVTGFTVNGTGYTAGTTVTIADVGTIVINADGSYTFTPAPDFSGTVPSVGYAISDGNGGTASANLNLTVTPVNDAPVAVADTESTPEDTPVSGDVITNDTDADNDPLTVTGFTINGQSYTAGATASVPNVGTLVVNADGTWTFTPEKDYNGTVPSATYTISDGKGGTASTTLGITVTPVPDPPVAYPNAYTTDEDAAVTGNVLTDASTANELDSDPDNDALTVTGFIVNGQTYTAGTTATLTGVGTLVVNADGSFTFTPELNYNGPVPQANYSISDGNGGTASSTLDIAITPVNDAPIAYPNSYNTDEDKPVTGDLLADLSSENKKDSDPDNDDLSVKEFAVNGQTYAAGTTATLTGVGTLKVNADGTFTFTPEPDYDGSVPQTTYTITDGNGGEASSTLDININPVNDPPVAYPNAYTTNEDVAATGNVLTDASAANKLDSDTENDVLTVTGFKVNGQTYAAGTTATLTGVGTLVVNADGSFTFTPELNYDGPVPQAEYTISDGNGGEASSTLDITITPVNDNPVAVDNTNSTTQDRPVSGEIIGNDSDPENDPLAISDFTVNGVQYTPGTTANFAGVGTLVVNADGTYTFDPEPGFIGKLDVPYTVCDNATPPGCATATIRLMVEPSESDPDVNATFANTSVKGDVSTNDKLPYAVNYGIPVPGSSPEGSTATITLNADGSYVFKADKPGVYVYEVPLCSDDDEPGTCPVEKLTIHVLEETAEFNNPVANVDIAYTSPSTAVTLKTLANDGPGTLGANLDPASVAVTIQPANGTVSVDAATGEITYTPNAGFLGVDVYTYTVCDNGIPAKCVTAQQEVTVIQSGVFNLTQAADDYASTLEGTSVSGSVLTNDTDPEGNTSTVTPQDITLPEGKFTLAADGSYTFEPAVGFSGPVNVPYSKCDNGAPQACADATVYILVKPFDPQPDVNATFVGAPINGTIVTNDQVYSGAQYGLDSADPANPTGATITVNPDGTYQFSATKPGVYVYVCLLCQQLDNSSGRGSAPSILNLPYRSLSAVSCKPVTLTITVLDPYAAGNAPIANTDIASTLKDTPVKLKTLGNDFPGSPGVTLVPSSVAIATQPANGTVSVNAQTGDITYTPAAGFTGVDEYTYTICDSQNPQKCATATQKITVIEPTAPNSTLAADDFNYAPGPVPISGNLLNNDTDPQGQTQTVVPQNLSLPEGTFVLNANGSYTFTAAQGFSGPVEIPYTACDNGTPQACASATLYILVSPASIDAVNNDFTSTPVNGYTGGVAGNIYPNDLVNGLQLQSADVTLTLVSNGGVTGLTITSTGALTVPAGTPAGTYTVTYRICQVQVPSLCDEATAVFVVVPPMILATTDDFTANPISNEQGGVAGNIFPNDKLNNTTIEGEIKTDVTITLLNNGGLTGVTIGNDGTVTVPAGTEPGTYTLRYKICDDLNPTNCSEADVIVLIEQTELKIPDGISPNGDGLNEVFFIEGLSAYPDNQILIFNRWGNKVYEAKPYQNNWDGTSSNSLTVGSGNRLPAGTYFYVLDLGTGKRLTGYLYIAY